jgi:DNA-directed RNA polymerase specialized sigma subunit
MKNPLEELDEYDKTATTERSQNDFNKWNTWMQGGQKPEHLEPLLAAFKPVITQAVNTYRAPTVQKSAFEAAAIKHAIEAFKTYDPNRGAALATHVIGRMKKLQRENNKVHNKAYIPEGKAQLIGPIQRATTALREDLEREPEAHEIARHLGVPVKRVQSVIGSMKKDIMASQFESDPTKIISGRDQEVLDLLPYSLKSEEKEVFDYLFGRNGKPRLDKTNDIARALGKNPSQISRFRTSILDQYNEHMKRSI